ncbi:MAG: hypothetical protein QXL77_05175 [Candidatus Bathyarchaeia archaeon]
MMYEILLELWKNESESDELVKLPPDFYSQVAEYVKRLKEEERMIDRKTLRADLLRAEMRNVRRIVSLLAKIRYRKIVRLVVKGKIPLDMLAVDERNIFTNNVSFSFAGAFLNLIRNVLMGIQVESGIDKAQKMAVVRFLRDIPAIIGADMKAYGPFKCEDVASLPIENVKILARQKLVERVEVKGFHGKS